MVSTPEAVEIGIDIGGTFTDVVCHCDGAPTRIIKIPTTRANPASRILSTRSPLRGQNDRTLS